MPPPGERPWSAHAIAVCSRMAPMADLLTTGESEAKGKESRRKTPRSSLGAWEPAADRVDPVKILEGQDKTRLKELVPIRHGRMGVSAFTFYRGAAGIM